MIKNHISLAMTSITVAIIEVTIDYVAKSANSEFVLRNDLPYLPGLLAAVSLGWLYQKYIKAAILGVVASITSAALLYLLVGRLIEIYTPYSSVYAAVGPQLAYLIVPIVMAILLGGHTACKFTRNHTIRARYWCPA